MSDREDRFSFMKGWKQVRQMDKTAVKGDIMDTLGLTTNMGWGYRLYGRVEPKITEVERINAIFAKYGITENIWGLAETEVKEVNNN